MICSAFSAPNRVRCASNRIKSHTIARDSTQSHTPHQKTSYLCISFKTTKSPLTPLSPHSNTPYPACLQACDASKASRRGLEQTPYQLRLNSDSTPTKVRPPGNADVLVRQPSNPLMPLISLMPLNSLMPLKPLKNKKTINYYLLTINYLPLTPSHSLPKIHQFTNQLLSIIY